MGKGIELQTRAERCLEVCSSEMSHFFCTNLAGIFGPLLPGVSLPDDDPDAGQGSKFCLVAIGRLQVSALFPFPDIALSRESPDLKCSV